jgi:AsmA protein
MGKLLRLIGIAAGVLLVLVVAAVILLPMFIDPNDYKDEIAEAVESNTGRTLAMQGDIGLSVFPWLGLDIGSTSLSNAPGFSTQPFASVDAVQVRVKLLPLLRKELQMDTVVLEGLRVSLETDKQGRTNWADLAGKGEAKPEQPGQKEPSAAELSLAGLAIGGVRISDAALVWDDQKNAARYAVNELNLRTGAIAPGEEVPVEFNMVLDASAPEVSGPIDFDGRIALSADGQTVQVSAARLQTGLVGETLPGGALKSALGFSTSLNLDSQQLAVTDLLLEAFGLQIEGHLNGANVLEDAAFDGEFKVKEFVPRELIEALGQVLPEVSDPSVLTRADASLKLAATLDSVSVSDLLLRLDDSTLKGALSVAQFASPAIRFGLHLDAIDVDRYLPPRSEETPAPATPTTAAAAGTQMIPVDTLRGLNVNGKLTIDKLKAAQLRSTDIVVQLVAKDGVVRVHPASARMYQGRYQGDLTMDVRGQQPRLSMNENLSGVQVGPLLKDMYGKETLTGATRASAKLTASGQTPDEFKKALNGNIAFAFTEGAVKGFNLAAKIREAQALLKGQPAPAESGPNQTDFSELTGTATVTNGVIKNKDLSAKSPLLRVDGKGSVDLPAETLDYLLTTKVVGSLEGQGGSALADLAGVAIPVKISGTFAEPSFKVRLDKALKKSLKKKAKKQAEKELKDKLGDDLGDQLKGLFD